MARFFNLFYLVDRPTYSLRVHHREALHSYITRLPLVFPLIVSVLTAVLIFKEKNKTKKCIQFPKDRAKSLPRHDEVNEIVIFFTSFYLFFPSLCGRCVCLRGAHTTGFGFFSTKKETRARRTNSWLERLMNTVQREGKTRDSHFCWALGQTMKCMRRRRRDDFLPFLRQRFILWIEKATPYWYYDPYVTHV